MKIIGIETKDTQRDWYLLPICHVDKDIEYWFNTGLVFVAYHKDQAWRKKR